MSGLLELGLFVASGYRSQKDKEAAAAQRLAEAAAKAQEKQDQIDLKKAEQGFIAQREITVAEAAADREALDQRRALGVRTSMWGDGNGNIEYTTSLGPEMTKSPGPGWTQLATALGYNPGSDGNKFNLNSDFTPDPNIPLFDFRGTPRTAKQIKDILLQENASLPPLMQLDLSGPGVSSKITGPAIPIAKMVPLSIAPKIFLLSVVTGPNRNSAPLMPITTLCEVRLRWLRLLHEKPATKSKQ